jgi:1-acyl-sn-glycerol-3-phosphate acyltransferase
MFRFFVLVFTRLLRKSFSAARVANLPEEAVFRLPRLVIFSNHPSWWDAVTFLFVADRFLPGRASFAPIDAAMVARYRFLSRVGAFGVEQGGSMGARRFLEACRIIFADPGHALLITAQARFADCRERPLALAGGIAHIADLAPDATFLPLAIEYPHWIEKQPELLLRFGEPILASEFGDRSAESRLQRLEAALTDTMDILARDSMARDASAFKTVLTGRARVNGIYDLWRRASAAMKGQSFRVRHGAPP